VGGAPGLTGRSPQHPPDRPELASALLDLREKPPEPLAPSPQALGVWELAWPTIVSVAMQTLVRWADVKMVGVLGRDAIAGVMAGGHVYWFIQSVVMAVTTGLVALVARAAGARDTGLVDATLRQGIILGTALGVVTMALGLPLVDAAIAIYGVEPSVVAYGSTYLLWLLIGNVPFTLTFVFAAALRAAGDSRTPLYVGVFANALNVLLNWILIYGKLGFPALGVAGAAIASGLAMLFQVMVFWAAWARGRLILERTAARFTPDPVLWRRLLRIGYPATIEGAIWHLGLLVFMRLMSSYGTAEFAAYNIGAQILALSFLPGVGFSTAASTLVGQHLGEGDPLQAARSSWRSLAGAVCCMTLLGASIIALAEPIAGWFIPDAEVVRLTVDFIWILGIVQPLMAVEFTLGGALRGAGDTRYPLVVVFIGLLGCRLVPASIAAGVYHASIQVVWSALVLDYAAKALLLLVRFYRGRWKTIEV
jgi:putative MATE family efflux protein